MLTLLSRVPFVSLAEPALEVVTQYLERRSYFGVFVLLFLGAFGPSPPEEVVLLIAGFMVFQGIARFPYIVAAALAGIVVSDSILYGFGVLFGGSDELVDGVQRTARSGSKPEPVPLPGALRSSASTYATNLYPASRFGIHSSRRA